MVQIISEGQYEFRFDAGFQAEKLDPLTTGVQGWKSADFAVTGPDGSIMLIEVKDPSNSNAPPEALEKKRKEMKAGVFVIEELTPKARDSCAFLRLMGRINGPVNYLVYIGDEGLNLERTLFSEIDKGLRKRLKQEAPEPWQHPYVRESFILLASRSPDTSPFGFRVRRQA